MVNGANLWTYLAPGGVLSALGIYLLRNMVRKDQLGGATTRGEVGLLATLRAERESAVKRADDLSDQLYKAFQELGELRGKLEALNASMQHQSGLIEHQSSEIARLRSLLEARP